MSDDNSLMQKMRGFPNVKTIVNFINLESTKEMIDYRDQYGRTPLFYACEYNKLEIVKALLKKGADVNEIVKGNKISAALNLSVQYRVDDEEDLEDKLKIIDLLIKAGSNINIEIFNFVCLIDDIPIIKKLLEYPIDLEKRDKNGWLSTDYLIKNKNTEMLKIVESQILKNKLEEKLSIKESTSNKMKI